MGLMQAVRGLAWARRRQPDEVAYVASLGHERFTPQDLVAQAVEAETAGFDGVCCSDHLAPWWDTTTGPSASCGNAWVWLGAAGGATSRVAVGTGVTALVHRYNRDGAAADGHGLDRLRRDALVLVHKAEELSALLRGRSALIAGGPAHAFEGPATRPAGE